MHLRPLDIAPEGEITFRAFTVNLQLSDRDGEVLLLKFGGTYGIGCEGNGNARYMEAMVVASLQFVGPCAVIYDLSELDYQWGDLLQKVLCSGDSPSGYRLPYAVVVSHLCETGISSLLLEEMDEDISKMHPSVASALDFLAEELNARNL